MGFHFCKILQTRVAHVAFLAVLFAIPVAMIVAMEYTENVSTKENRELAPLPNVFITNEAFPKKMDNFINDRIGFRQELLDIAEFYPILQGGKNIGASASVIPGEDNWLFYNDSITNENTRDFIKSDTYTSEDLKKISAAFKEVNDWCLSHGIKLIVMIPPIKHNIYPEYFNKAYIQLERPTRYELVRDVLKEDGIPFLDLRSALLDAKKDTQVYYRNDTHWNTYAGYIAYSMLIEKIDELGGKARKYDKNNFHIIELDDYHSGDLTRQGLNCNVKNVDKTIMLEFNDSLTIKDIEVKPFPDQRANTIRESGFENLAKLFIINDSFLGAVEPFLVRSVSRMVTRWEWGYSPLKYAKEILEEKPDFLIWEMHERYLAAIRSGAYKHFENVEK